MFQLQPVRGTHDLLPDEMRRYRHVVDTARAAAECAGYLEIETPIFEFSEVFKRTLGDTSDIVTKEMYTFTDRGGETITLRPEGTASVARAFISEGLAQHVPLKYFYSGPMFRYERPQKGRLRQFHQTGVELLGVADPLGDVEIIAVGVEFLRRIGVWERCYLEINSLGDAESRKAYRDVLVSYLSSHKDKLSKDSVERLERNPMRILDSKDEGDRQIVADAPVYSDHLNQASKDFFSRVLEGLDAIGIPHAINPRLVRGLDYYCHTCFEIISDDLGAQGTVMGGGRYDGLVSIMGGPETPGVGWASGVERCMMLLRDEPKARRPIALVPIGADAERQALILADRIRQAGLPADLGYSGNMGKRMKRANKLNARVAIILGETELAKNVAAVRDLDSGEQREVPLDALIESLARHQ
ncbi:MAG TPA: histidine--tRNA ligase [Dongiaceae bacterium]|nr:histidine--tRNA ligase [Dongiaceae bacterium]